MILAPSHEHPASLVVGVNSSKMNKLGKKCVKDIDYIPHKLYLPYLLYLVLSE
jgi:hypothetical protein